MIRWQKTNSDGGLFNVETIRLTTYRIAVDSINESYTSVVSGENGTETVGNYTTEAEAEAGHSALCRKYGLK